MINKEAFITWQIHERYLFVIWLLVAVKRYCVITKIISVILLIFWMNFSMNLYGLCFVKETRVNAVLIIIVIVMTHNLCNVSTRKFLVIIVAPDRNSGQRKVKIRSSIACERESDRETDTKTHSYIHRQKNRY